MLADSQMQASLRLLEDEQLLFEVIDLAYPKAHKEDSPEQKLAMIFLIEALFPLETLREMIGKEFGFPHAGRH